MSKNLRLYLLLGVLFVLLVTAGVVFYPTYKNYFKKDDKQTTVNTAAENKAESNKVPDKEPDRPTPVAEGVKAPVYNIPAAPPRPAN